MKFIGCQYYVLSYSFTLNLFIVENNKNHFTKYNINKNNSLTNTKSCFLNN